MLKIGRDNDPTQAVVDEIITESAKLYDCFTISQLERGDKARDAVEAIGATGTWSALGQGLLHFCLVEQRRGNHAVAVLPDAWVEESGAAHARRQVAKLSGVDMDFYNGQIATLPLAAFYRELKFSETNGDTLAELRAEVDSARSEHEGRVMNYFYPKELELTIRLFDEVTKNVALDTFSHIDSHNGQFLASIGELNSEKDQEDLLHVPEILLMSRAVASGVNYLENLREERILLDRQAGLEASTHGYDDDGPYNIPLSDRNFRELNDTIPNRLMTVNRPLRRSLNEVEKLASIIAQQRIRKTEAAL